METRMHIQASRDFLLFIEATVLLTMIVINKLNKLLQVKGRVTMEKQVLKGERILRRSVVTQEGGCMIVIEN